MHMQKIKVKCQLVQKNDLNRTDTTDRIIMLLH